MTPDQLAALRYTAKHAVCLSRDIGMHVGGSGLKPHGASAKGTGLLLPLLRLGYVERNYDRAAAAYMYSITNRGRIAVLEHLPGLTRAV